MGSHGHLGLFLWHLPRALLEDATGSSVNCPSPFPPPSPPKSSLAPFRPSIAVIVGVLTTMFSITFLLLLYAKHCKRTGSHYGGNTTSNGIPTSSAHRNSGVERTVIESLPVFRFGSLRGQKDGLECAVCLTRFEPAEVLRLLPKCKHAFHVECVDTWLDAHSTCPLCRCRVDPEDVLLVQDPAPAGIRPETEIEDPSGGEKRRESNSCEEIHNQQGFIKGGRVSGRHSSAGEKSSNSLQIVVHRTGPDESVLRNSVDNGILRSTVSTAGCFDRGRKDGLLETVDQESIDRRFGHRIIVSRNAEEGGGDQRRWSDLRPSDLLFLRSEMIITDSGRYSVSRHSRVRNSCSSASGGTRSVIMNTRSLSELTGVSRFPTGTNGAPRRQEEERTLRRWLGFAAKRMARWLGSREINGSISLPASLRSMNGENANG